MCRTRTLVSAVIAVVVALVLCRVEGSLSCLVQQAAPPLVPTAQVLPGGNVLFNDLQYAINQCPFAVVVIDAPASCGVGEDATRVVNASGCISITSRIEPIRIAGVPSGPCRSVLLFNASWCSRGVTAAIAVDNAVSVTLSDLTVAWSYAPSAQHNLTFLSSVNVISVALHRVVANLTVTSEWSSDTSPASSDSSHGSNPYYPRSSLPFALWRFQYTQNVTIVDCVLQLVSDGTSKTPVSDTHSDWNGPSVVVCVRIAPRTLLWFEEVPFGHISASQLNSVAHGGKILRATNSTIFVDGISAEVGSVSASSYGVSEASRIDDDRASFRAVHVPPVCNPTPNEPFLFLDQFSGSRFVNSVVHLHCGTTCAAVLVPAVVAFRSSTAELELAEGLILRNLTLNLVDPPNSLIAPPATVLQDAFGVVNFIAIRSLTANCILVDAIAFQNAPSLSCTALLFTAPAVYNSLISRPTMMVATSSGSNNDSGGGVATSFDAVPMSQSFRSASQPSPTGLQLWLEPSPSPLDSLFDDLEETYAPITNCTLTPLPGSGGGPPVSAFYQCCTVQSTVFYSAAAVIVTILVGLATLRAASHRSGGNATTADPVADSVESTPGCFATDRGSGVDSRKATVASNDTEEPLLSAPRRSTPQATAEPLAAASSKPILGGAGASSSQTAFLHATVTTTPGGGTAVSIPRMTSGTASDMILYLPGGDGWSAHSVHGGWQWSPNNHGVFSHGNSVVVSRQGSADRPHPITFVASPAAHLTPGHVPSLGPHVAAAAPSQVPAAQNEGVQPTPSNDSRQAQASHPHQERPPHQIEQAFASTSDGAQVTLGAVGVQAKPPLVVLVSGTADAVPFPVASRAVASPGSVHSSEYSDSTAEATDDDDDTVN